MKTKIKYALSVLLILVYVATFSQINGAYPQASTRLLTDEDLKILSADELKEMRNEIFARYGYIFKNPKLKKHFEIQPWYKPLKADVTAELTSTEKANIDLIRKWEERIAKTSDFSSFYSIFKKAMMENNSKKLSELVIYEFYKTPAEFINSFEIHKNELKEELSYDETYPTERGLNEMVLRFGERYQGVQYKWIEFHKVGFCWYIFAIGRAG
jgi:hypothetical protein